MASIFTKIVEGDIPSYKIAETEDCLAFLDAFPLNEGHVLVIPKKEVDKIYDLDANTYLNLMALSHKIAIAMDKVFDCKRIGMAVIGLEVPHAHVHLTPISAMDDLNFNRSKLKFSAEEYQAMAEKISNALEF